jgi:hypothetical protein
MLEPPGSGHWPATPPREPASTPLPAPLPAPSPPPHFDRVRTEITYPQQGRLRGVLMSLTYNERPTWLVNAHRDLDAAVASAYGWPADISEDEALARLLALNHARTVNVSADSVFEVEAKEAEFA